MAKKTSPLLPVSEDLLKRLGARLRLARLRRRLTAAQVAQRSGMAPMTLRSIERGGAGVTIGAYVAVMQILGIEKDLEPVASADPLGRELQDARLDPRGQRRSPGRAMAPPTMPPAAPASGRRKVTAKKARYPSAQSLATLLEIPRRRRSR